MSRFSLIVTEILRKVIPVRFLQWFRSRKREATQPGLTVRDRKANDSNATTIPPIPMVMPASMTGDPVTFNKEINRPGDPSTSKSFLHRAKNPVRQGLSVLSPIIGGAPVAGSLLKGSIDTLLVVLDGIHQKDQNKENAAHLIQRLYHLEVTISEVPPATGSAQRQRDELAAKLDAVSGRLKELQLDAILGSADVAQSILDCIREIDSHLFDHMALSQMRTENDMQAMREIFCDNQGQLPTPVHQGIIYVMDAAGREHQLLVSHCKSREAFMRFLECDFKSGKKDRILRHFMGQGAYDLFIEDGTITTQLDGWSRIRPGMRIIMSIVLENSLFGDDYKCPRCKIWNNHKEENDGWIDCVGCPGRFQITNANRKRNKTGTKFGQNPQGSMYPSASDYRPHLDVILNFHLRQHFFRPPLQGWIPRQIHDQESLSVQPVLGSHECSTHQEKSFLPKLTWGQLRTANIG